MTSENVQNTLQTPAENVQKDKEINFERMRKQLEQEKTEKLRLQEEVSQLRKSQEQLTRSKQPEFEEDDTSDEPYVDHKVLSRKFAKWEQKLEEKIDKKAEEKARQLLEQERQQSYVKSNADFNEVLTQENIQKFAEKHPAMAERMLRMPDTFDRQALLYEQIKALQIGKKEESKPSIQQVIEANQRSPYYQPSGVGTAPYAPMGDFSKGGQKAAYDKMQELKSKLRI